MVAGMSVPAAAQQHAGRRAPWTTYAWDALKGRPRNDRIHEHKPFAVPDPLVPQRSILFLPRRVKHLAADPAAHAGRGVRAPSRRQRRVRARVCTSSTQGSSSMTTCFRYESSMVGSYVSTKWLRQSWMVRAVLPTPPSPSTTMRYNIPAPAPAPPRTYALARKHTRTPQASWAAETAAAAAARAAGPSRCGTARNGGGTRQVVLVRANTPPRVLASQPNGTCVDRSYRFQQDGREVGTVGERPAHHCTRTPTTSLYVSVHV
jgi:hypothetical protein